ncbi:MAG: hypothetical protein ACU0DI_02370 [Paracoccaceae bacterium]
MRPFGPGDISHPFRVLGQTFGESIFNNEKVNSAEIGGISVTWANMGLRIHSLVVVCG